MNSPRPLLYLESIMTPHAVMIGDLGPRHFAVFQRVVAVVNSLPDGLTCHEVCEAVAGVIPQVWWVKGKFAGWDHSWLEVKRERVVIDAYPWASHAPFMVVNQTGTPWALLYRGEVVGHTEVGGSDARNHADAEQVQAGTDPHGLPAHGERSVG